jgi:hypothetical protein
MQNSKLVHCCLDQDLVADTTVSFYCPTKGLEKVAEERCDAEEIFMDGEPCLGGVNYQANGPTTKSLLDLAMRSDALSFFYLCDPYLEHSHEPSA